MTRAPSRLGQAAALVVVTLLAMLAGSLAVSAQESGFTIRTSQFDEDGTTTLTIAVQEPLDTPLTAGDIQVTEDGVPVTDLTVQSVGSEGVSGPDVAVALLIDTSGSTAGEPLAAAKEAAKAFLDELEEIGAAAAVIEFKNEVFLRAPLTSDLDGLDAVIDAMEASGATLLYDSVLLAADLLGDVDALRTIVIFSDGDDNGSTASESDAIQAALAVDAPIMNVILVSEVLNLEVLERLAIGSGGMNVAVESADELAAAFDEVAATLTNLYVVQYTASTIGPPELNMSVTVDLPSGTTSQSFTALNPRRAAPVIVDPQPVERTASLLTSPVALIVGLVLAFVALAAVLFFLVQTPRSRASRNLERELSTYVEGGRRHADSSAVAEALRRQATALLGRSEAAARIESRVQKMLDQGQIPLRSVELLAIMVLAGLLAGGLGLLLVGWRAFFVFAPIAFIIPWLFVVVRRARRLKRFLEMLPDTLQLIAGSLSAGYGVVQALDMVAKESEDPVSTEFNRVLVESRLGMPLDDSLRDMAERMDSDDFLWVVLAMNIQREVGGNLAALMNTVATTLREREALRRHIKALSAEGKLSAVVLVLLPIFLAVYLILVNPAYVGTLTQSLIGFAMIGVGAVGMIIGIFWIRGLIRAIEV
jgi:tight adherence protein B